MKKIEKFILSWDFLAAIIAMGISYGFVCNHSISNEFCYTIYGTAITVLSIIFSIFFASLTVIMAFPDNEFITFIENPKKIFSRLLKYFKDTLFALFFSLIFTICVYIYALYFGKDLEGNKILFVLFSGVFIYSLFATAIAVNVTLSITSSRANFLFNKKEEVEEDETE